MLTRRGRKSGLCGIKSLCSRWTCTAPISRGRKCWRNSRLLQRSRADDRLGTLVNRLEEKWDTLSQLLDSRQCCVRCTTSPTTWKWLLPTGSQRRWLQLYNGSICYLSPCRPSLSSPYAWTLDTTSPSCYALSGASTWRSTAAGAVQDIPGGDWLAQQSVVHRAADQRDAQSAGAASCTLPRVHSATESRCEVRHDVCR
eukprot:21704-Pleurochrysis_carterae.AAC.1